MAAQVNAMLTQTLGPGQGAGPGQRRPQRQPGQRGRAHVRRQGRAARRSTAQTESLTGAAAPSGAAGTAGNIPAYAQTGTGNSKYTQQDHQHDARRRQDRHAHGDRPGSGQPPDRLGADRQVGAGRRDPGTQDSRRQRRRPRTPSAATRSRSGRWRSPSRRRRRRPPRRARSWATPSTPWSAWCR